MFKIGDVVQLKSGGPHMTVQRLIGAKDAAHPMLKTVDQHLKIRGFADGDPVCQWFAGPELKSDAFTTDTLELAPKSNS